MTDADFGAVIGSGGLVLVDFWAPWCDPCAKVTPIVEALVAEHAGTLEARALDVEANPGVVAEHAVLALPTVIIFRDGTEVERLAGSVSDAKLRKALARHLPEPAP